MLTGAQQLVLYTAALSFPFVVTLLMTPIAGKLAHRWDILDHPSQERHHAQVTPYLGGVAVGLGVLVVGSFMATASSSGQLVTILFGATAMFVVGILDDRRDIGPILKLGVEFAAAAGLWLVGVRVTLFNIDAINALVTVLWIVGITNAVNLLDNMDGLASGFSAIASGTLFAIAAWRGDYLVASFALSITGASLGFLRHNFPPARIFLGDAGSLMLGFFLASLTLKLDLVGKTGVVRTLVPVMILGVPVFDTALVVITRISERRPVYIGGIDHSSHRLSHQGLSPKYVALLIFLLQASLSILALGMLYLSDAVAIIIGGGVLLAAAAAMFMLFRVRPHLVSVEPVPATHSQSSQEAT